MSLAPGERQALASIEDSLCRSDPRLATMLVTFTLPACRGRTPRRKRLSRGALPAMRLIVAGLVLAVLSLAVAGALARNGLGNPLCTPVSRNVIAGRQALSCPPARSGAPSRPSRPAGFSGVHARPARPAARCGTDPGGAAADRGPAGPGGMTGRNAGKC